MEHVSERLTTDDQGKPLIFRNSMIDNIRDLVDIVPRLNIFQDPDLAHLCDEVKTRIANVDPNELRPSASFNHATRTQVKNDADALLEKFSGYFTAATAPQEEAA